MSRPRPFAVGQFGFATWSFEVATWGRLPGLVATSARPASARPALVAHVTCARPVGCAHSSAHDLGTATWVLGVRIVHPNQFCDRALFRSLFEHCSQGKKKKILVYDLIYKIFIWKLLQLHRHGM